MSALCDLAPEYRRAAAKLALRLKEREASMTKEQRASYRQALTELREVSRLLDGYYTAPRPEGISAAGWKGRVIDIDDD